MTEQETGEQGIRKVLVTGSTGFVGRHILRKLIAHGYEPVCLYRDAQRFDELKAQFTGLSLAGVQGSLSSQRSLQKAVEQSDAVIHLAGIIMERGANTFSRVHYEGTKNVVDACQRADVGRFVHMSALGCREDAISKYHRTKYQAEEYVRKSGLDWTIFRPSIIHGPDGEFMELMKTFVSATFLPPVIPYFGSGDNRLQPVDVRDVSECFVKALTLNQTIHQIFELGGPRSYSWKELYRLCQRLIPGSKHWKPIVGQPVLLAKVLASTVMKIPSPLSSMDKLRFDVGQVQMSQEDSVCDITPVEHTFDVSLRDFETELRHYADQIR